MNKKLKECIFCNIASKKDNAIIVYENKLLMVILDNKPLQLGHCLVISKDHIVNFLEMPDAIIPQFFIECQKIANAVKNAMNAEGIFMANNNIVSQSVPHLHVHIVPRRKKDGLIGFFWPRRKYKNEEHAREIALAIREHLKY